MSSTRRATGHHLRALRFLFFSDESMKTKPNIEDPRTHPYQFFLSDAIQQGQLLEQLIGFTGRASILVTSFSTAEEFLMKCWRLKREGLIDRATILLDIKAVEKTARIRSMIGGVFDRQLFAPNHSKCMVIQGEDMTVTTLCSQNTTRGGRLESYVITTDPQAARAVEDALDQLAAFTIDNNANPTNP